MDKKEELRILNLLYNVIVDKTVQKRFESTTTCNMETGELGKKRLIDECEEYVTNKINELIKEERK